MPTVSGIVVATGNQATGRRRLIDVVDELSRPVDAIDETVRAMAADAFRSIVRKMNRKGCFPWESMEEDVAISNNERFSTVSSAIKKPLAMHKLNAAGGTRDERIRYEEYDVFLERYDLSFGTYPTVYTIPNLFETGQVRWYPTPSADDNARFSFYRVTPAPKSDQEVIEIPDYVTEAYMAGAWYEFLKRLPSEQQAFNLAIAKSDWKDAFRELSAHVNQPGDRSRQSLSYGAY